MNWGETPSGVMSNFGTGSSSEACNGGKKKKGEEKRKNVLVIRTLEQTLKVATRKFVATTTL